jgi:hypothetical protein
MKLLILKLRYTLNVSKTKTYQAKSMVNYETPYATDLGGKLVQLCGDDVFSSVQRLIDAGANLNVPSQVRNRDDSRAAFRHD